MFHSNYMGKSTSDQSKTNHGREREGPEWHSLFLSLQPYHISASQ